VGRCRRVVYCRAKYGRRRSNPTLQLLDAGLEAFHNLANAAHLVELDLELINFAEDAVEAGDFGVGHLDGVASAVVLNLGGRLCLLRELEPMLVGGFNGSIVVKERQEDAIVVFEGAHSRPAIAAGWSTSSGQSGR
jgi:hypothetical protein